MSNRRTDVEMLVSHCSRHFRKANWGREKTIVNFLMGLQGWTVARAQSALHKALKDETLVSSHGGSIVYSGADRTLYKPVAHGLVGVWGARAGLRHRLVLATAHCHGGKHNGLWQHPDLIMLADSPGIADTADREVHAIEVEQKGGFIVSVYQAYEQGRGADYKWVFSVGVVPEGSARNRLEVAIKELGVGWVEMPRITAPSGWVTRFKARRRDANLPVCHRDDGTVSVERNRLLQVNQIRNLESILGARNEIGFVDYWGVH